MSTQISEPAALNAWPRAVMATLLLLISLLTAHLVQLTWFGDARTGISAPAPDLAHKP